MAQPNSQTTRELAKLGANFASIDISNSHIAHSKLKNACMYDKDLTRQKEVCYYLYEVKTVQNDQGTVSGTAILLNLLSPILENLQYITMGDAGQHSTRMRCYFHSQHHFLDYSDPVLDGAVIYAGDIPFWCSRKECTYTEFVDNPTGNIFLARNRDEEFLLNHRNTALHTSAES